MANLESQPLILKTFSRDATECAEMNALQKFGVEFAQHAFATAINQGMLESGHLKGNVVDFGCGCGGSSWVLAKNGAQVTAVDLNERLIAELRRLNALPADSIRCEDGIAYLDNLPARSVDLVTAFMLGPDAKGDFIRKFYQAANHALKDDGRIIVTSDLGTLLALEKVVPTGFGFFNENVFLGIKHTPLVSETIDAHWASESFPTKLVSKYQLFGDQGSQLSPEDRERYNRLFSEIIAKFPKKT